jgi:molybdopterin molybdotransferase
VTNHITNSTIFQEAIVYMLTVDEALASILQHVTTAVPQTVPLGDCLSRVLAENLLTPHDSPPFDKSMMDGFVVNSTGLDGGTSQTLSVLETITAGTVPTWNVVPGTASRIMTGAPIPDGGDCVIPIERVRFDEGHPETVTISGIDVAAERHILRQGCLAKTGEPLLSQGTIIEPQHIAVLAEFGVAEVPVFRRPTVAVLATGDELLPIDQPLTAGRIRNSNEPMLVGQIQRAQATAVPLGIARDDHSQLQACIQRGLECDFLLLSGGVSAGTLDLVPSELATAGVEQVFHKIQMKPGKPLWFGQRTADGRKCLVFGLPGNPVSSMICFELFVRTALRAFCGALKPEPTTVRATLSQNVAVRGDRLTYFPAKCVPGESGMMAEPVRWGGSADLRSTADANGMIVLEPRAEEYESGERVDAVLW